MTFSNKQVKLFKKTYNQFIDEYSELTNITVIKKNIREKHLSNFLETVNINLDEFLDRKLSIQNFKLFEKFQLDNLKLDPYTYLHTLYVIASKDNSKENIKRMEDSKIERKTQQDVIVDILASPGINKLMTSMTSSKGNEEIEINPSELISDCFPDLKGNKQFQNLLQTVTNSVTKNLGNISELDTDGEQLDITEISSMINSAISGKTDINIGGINIGNILEATKTDVNNAIENGQLTITEIHENVDVD